MFISARSRYTYNCCRHCSNNPANNPHASGICNCVLPYMEMNGGTGDYGPVTTTTEYVTNPNPQKGGNTYITNNYYIYVGEKNDKEVHEKADND